MNTELRTSMQNQFNHQHTVPNQMLQHNEGFQQLLPAVSCSPVAPAWNNVLIQIERTSTTSLNTPYSLMSFGVIYWWAYPQSRRMSQWIFRIGKSTLFGILRYILDTFQDYRHGYNLTYNRFMLQTLVSDVVATSYIPISNTGKIYHLQ